MNHHGLRLKELLKKKGISDEAFCNMAGRSAAELKEIFTHHTFNNQKITAFCKILNISRGDFLSDATPYITQNPIAEKEFEKSPVCYVLSTDKILEAIKMGILKIKIEVDV